MRPITTRIVLLLLAFPSLVIAVNFTQCLDDFRTLSNGTGGVDPQGRPTSPAEAVGLTYEACTKHCGPAADISEWNEFILSLSAWLLPWLALVSRLPFGSANYEDNLASVVITIGSPALAAYSLVLTSLNTRLVYRRARRTAHRSSYVVAKALISLQQIPLELTRDERLLAFVSITDQWRREAVGRLTSRNVWSVATGLFVGFIVIAFVFTTVNSISPLDDTGGSYEGHAIGTLWLWLLCLVIGWFRVPAYTYRELGSAIQETNQKAAKRAKAAKAYDPPRKVVSRKSKEWVSDPVPEVGEENEKVEVESIQEGTEPVRQKPEPQVDPFPGPARHRLVVALNSQAQSHDAHANSGVTAIQDASQNTVGVEPSGKTQSITQDSINPERDELLVRRRFDSLNWDEGRLVATFNYSRIIRYLILVDDVFRALDGLTRKRDSAPGDKVNARPWRTVVFPEGALTSMFIASIFALILQCGTTAAATIIVVFTPTTGVGCRSLGYMVYGGIAVLIMFLTIFSIIFARISETRTKSTVKDFTALVAIALRWISFLLAFANASWLIVLSFLQASGQFDTCYCNASVISRGMDSYVIFHFWGWFRMMEVSRIAATTLAVVCMATYMGFLWVTSASPSETEYL